MTRRKERTASRRLRKPLVPVAIALVALVAAGVAAAAAKWPTTKQEIATSGIQSSIKFCGTKPITLAVEDGFGVNAWSQESYAAAATPAATSATSTMATGATGLRRRKLTARCLSLLISFLLYPGVVVVAPVPRSARRQAPLVPDPPPRGS